MLIQYEHVIRLKLAKVNKYTVSCLFSAITNSPGRDLNRTLQFNVDDIFLQ